MLEPVKHVLVIVVGSCTGPNLTIFFVFISSDKKKAKHKERISARKVLQKNFALKLKILNFKSQKSALK